MAKPKKAGTGKIMVDADRPKKIDGRKPLDLDQRQFEELCNIQCTQEEILAVMRVDDNTLNAWCRRTYEGRTFSEVFAEKRKDGKSSLRRKQWKLADTAPAMAIFLGKNMLDQSDKQEIKQVDMTLEQFLKQLENKK